MKFWHISFESWYFLKVIYTNVHPYYFHRGTVLTLRPTPVGKLLLLPWLLYWKYPPGADRCTFTNLPSRSCVVAWVTVSCVSGYGWQTDVRPEFAHHSCHIQSSTFQMDPMWVWGDSRLIRPPAFVLWHHFYPRVTYVKSHGAFAPCHALTRRHSRPGLLRCVRPADPSLWRYPFIKLSCQSSGQPQLRCWLSLPDCHRKRAAERVHSVHTRRYPFIGFSCRSSFCLWLLAVQQIAITITQ